MPTRALPSAASAELTELESLCRVSHRAESHVSDRKDPCRAADGAWSNKKALVVFEESSVVELL